MANRKTSPATSISTKTKSKGKNKETEVKVKRVSKAVKRTTPTRKATVKTASKFDEQPMESSVDNSVTSSSSQTNRQFRVKKSYMILVIILLLLAAALYFGRSWVVAAVVNGQPISRFSVIHETEKQSGKQSLNNLVRNVLIEQEARKEHVTVSDQEVATQMKQVEANLTKQGQTLDQVLAMQGMTKSDLQNLIRLDQLVGKMVGKNIKISDAAISDYIDKNKDLLPKDQTDAQIRTSVRDRLKQQQLNDKVQTWLANLQSKANVLYFVNY